MQWQDPNAQISDNRWLYNGKERQTTGMPDGTHFLDYGARIYDPRIARWTAIDPLAEISRRWTPYNYALSNPLRYIDPDGRFVDDYFNLKGQYLGRDNALTDEVRIMSQKDWDSNKVTDGFIDHEVGNSKSTNITETKMSEDAVSNVVEHYDAKLDGDSTAPKSDAKVSAKNMTRRPEDAKIVMQHDPAQNTIKANMPGGKLHRQFGTASNITNALVHERGHDVDKTYDGTPARESRAIDTQQKHDSYEKTTDGFKNMVEDNKKKYGTH
jgi:RHS repeat-associated protein